MKTVIRILLMMSLVLSGWLPLASTQAMSLNDLPVKRAAVAPSNLIPAKPSGAMLPTIGLSASHGKLGESITVSGQCAVSYLGVRVAWLLSDATLTAAVVDVAANNAYSATITVLLEAVPGSARVCAAVSNTIAARPSVLRGGRRKYRAGHASSR